LGRLVYECVGRLAKIEGDILPRVYPVKHPRWYCSNGAVNPKSKAFHQMVLDYRDALTYGRNDWKKCIYANAASTT